MTKLEELKINRLQAIAIAAIFVITNKVATVSTKSPMISKDIEPSSSLPAQKTLRIKPFKLHPRR